MKKSAAAVPFAEQKGFAEEMDRRVARRTAELTATNEQLKKELAEHKWAEEDACEGETSFDLIVNSIPVPVAVTSPSGEVEALNQSTLEYFGKTLEELKGWKSSDVVHPDDLQRTVAAQLEAHQAGTSYNIESRHRRADGTYRWFNVLGLPLRDAQGHIRHWFHLQIDIDDRKRAEAQLAGEKRLLEMVASGGALKDVLTALCRFVEDIAADCKCGIYLIDWSGPTFHTGAAPSLPATFNDTLEGLTVEVSAGPCALAAFTKSQVIAENLESDLDWQQSLIRPLALGHGLRAQWSTPICSRDGSVLGTFAIFQDHPSSPTQVQQDLIAQVTHIASIAIGRALAEEALRSSERNLSLTIDTIPTFIQVSRPDGTVLSVNQAVLDYHGITLQDVQKEDFRTRVYHPDDLERLREERKEALKRPLQFEYEQRARGKDGKYRWFMVRYNPLLDDQGTIDRWYATAFDIEDRKRAQEDVRRSEAFLAETQRLTSIGSFSWLVATDEITWSEELYRIYEFDPGITITLEVIRTRVHPEDLTLYEKMVEQARNGADDFEWQYRLLMPDQSIKYMHAVAQATRDSGGQLEYIAAVRDVTARRLSDEALDRARSELARVARVMSLGALTASIAHEVNQPLSGIITNASTCMRMLDAEPPNVDGARETTKRTIRDGRRAADVITRLRALFTNKDAAAELVDLNEATREVIALSRTELERNGVVTRIELKNELPAVMGDRVQLQQVILNLLRNGSDAMSYVDDRPRELLFRTEVEEGDRVRLSVQDTGIGFEPQSLDRLFQTFYTTKDDGMGIGLAVSRSIVENHRGRMWATPNDGPGVTFSFSIPRAVAIHSRVKLTDRCT
ncbi:MAG TPA: PAS domain-containing protein [Pyrinomonadaceae bacterium]|nr:PAS domain-containing protein [Pyrinomonadaceae bacterium]